MNVYKLVCACAHCRQVCVIFPGEYLDVSILTHVQTNAFETLYWRVCTCVVARTQVLRYA